MHTRLNKRGEGAAGEYNSSSVNNNYKNRKLMAIRPYSVAD